MSFCGQCGDCQLAIPAHKWLDGEWQAPRNARGSSGRGCGPQKSLPRYRKIMIVKVQWPLSGETNVLVYNEARTIMQIVPCTEELWDTLKGKPKMFFHAHIENKMLVLDEPAHWQDW